jgi:hypothetical protein
VRRGEGLWGADEGDVDVKRGKGMVLMGSRKALCEFGMGEGPNGGRELLRQAEAGRSGCWV